MGKLQGFWRYCYMGEEGARTHLCSDMAFKRKDCIFTLCLALYSLLRLRNTACRILRERRQSGDSCFWEGKIEGILIWSNCSWIGWELRSLYHVWVQRGSDGTLLNSPGVAERVKGSVYMGKMELQRCQWYCLNPQRAFRAILLPQFWQDFSLHVVFGPFSKIGGL